MVTVTSYGAPGNYITETQQGTYAVPIIPINSIYLFAEIEEDVSSELDVGFPYNVPVPVFSLDEFEDRLAGGVANAFSVPTDPFALGTYNWVKTFFRNVGSGSTASLISAKLYVIRVKPVPGIKILVGEPTPVVVDNELVYSYRLTINNFRVGETSYDVNGDPDYYGVVVDPSATGAIGAAKIVDEIRQNVATDSSVYVRHEENSNIIEIYPRLNEQDLDVVPYNELVEGVLTGLTSSEILSSDDPLQPRPRVEAKDYIYAIDNSIDPNIHELGSMAAPVAFMKFNPEHRQAVGMAMENRTRADDLNWVYALVDSAPYDGRLIALHYGYEEFNLEDGEKTADPDPDQNDPIFIYESQGFYRVAYDGAGLPETTVAAQSINLPASFTKVLNNPIAGVEIPAGTVLIVEGKTYGVHTAFTPVSVPITLPNPNLKELFLVVDYTQDTPSTATTMSVESSDTKSLLTFTILGQEISVEITPSTVVNFVSQIQQALYQELGDTGIQVTVDDTVPTTVVISDPDGGTISLTTSEDSAVDSSSDVTITPGATGSEFPHLFAGQVLNNNGSLSWVKRYFKGPGTYIPATTLKNYTDPDVPEAYYRTWIKHNINLDKIVLATYDPMGEDGKLVIDARECPFNATSPSMYLRDGLMYTSPNGSLSYEYPYWVDFEGYEVPASAVRAGVMMRVFRNEGFAAAPAGLRYPANGVLRTVVEVSQAEQTRTNPRGLNAGIVHPNAGPVLWGSSTVSRRRPGNLFIWHITRQVMSVAIATLRRAFDEIIFQTIDSQDQVFAKVRSTAEDVLYRMYRGGALYGTTPNTAYRVICNKSNNPDFNLEMGIVNVDIFLIPVSCVEEIHTKLIRVGIGQLNN